jgi:dihydrofolate synthase/folylpolyglutamate synthase
MDSDISQTLEKIHSFCTFGSILGLDRMKKLCDKIDNPEKGLRVIHVGGTNGKGSVCRYIYEVLIGAGYKVGLYTSPYINIFNERIELNGKQISDEDLIMYSEMLMSMAKGMEEPPTEFELITAIALKYFKDKNADFVILEVGLGGRGDSTNIIDKPLISVITSIGFDHMDRLGNTLSEIAYEKAGIIKEGVPVVSAVYPFDAKEVIITKAEEKNADFIDVTGFNYDIITEEINESKYRIDAMDISLSMGGKHQIINSLTAYKALVNLRDRDVIGFSNEQLREGFKRAKQPGRMEIFGDNPKIIIDGAHNIDGILALSKTIRKSYMNAKILIIVGVLRDKTYDEMLGELALLTDEFIATEPNNERKLSSLSVAEALEAHGAKCLIEPNPKDAFERAMEIKDNYDVIVFAGSLYLIGEIRSFLEE